MLKSPPWRYLVGVVLLAVALVATPAAWLARPIRYVVEAFHTRSSAMSPTMAPGDRFLCHKHVALRRWDLAVFEPPHAPGSKYVFRIVGLPGETIEVKDGGVFVTGVAQPNPPGVAPYVGDTVASMRVLNPGTTGRPVTLGPDEYYVLGDNTAFAAHSPTWDVAFDNRRLGVLPRDRIVGRVTYIYWPVARWRKF